MVARRRRQDPGQGERGRFLALEHDLLRYCTRLRCQPQTDAHTDAGGYAVPAHQLIAKATVTIDDVDHLACELWKANRSGSRRWEDLPADVRWYWRDRARQTHARSH